MTDSKTDPRLRRAERALQALVLWLLGSMVLHLGFWLFLYRGATARAAAQEQLFRGQDGENGRSRFGGSTVDFENAPVHHPEPAVAPTTLPSTPAPVVAPSNVNAARPVIAVRQPHQAPPIAQPNSTPTPATAPTPTPTTVPTAETHTSPEPAHSTEPSSDESIGGARTGSVGEQRAMLPAARRCNDPVAGVWRAHKYSPAGHDWVIFTLRIERDSANHLRGSILARLWSGLSMDSRPPGRCNGRLMDLDYLIRQPASGEYTPTGVVMFHGETWETERAYCQSAYFGYNLDSFDGTIDQERQEFQSRNNDGGRDRNAPYVFRRIGCLAGDSISAATTTVSDAEDSGTVAH